MTVESKEKEIQEQAKAIYSGFYAEGVYNQYKLTGKGAICGAVAGFVISVMYQKPKFTTTVLGCFVGGLAGYGLNKTLGQ